jgi:hypothetical protein
VKNDENKQNEQEENEKVGKLLGIGASHYRCGNRNIDYAGRRNFYGRTRRRHSGQRSRKKIGGGLLNKLGGKEETTSASNGKKDITAELERLAKLHKQGVLNDEEFKAAKASLLNI